MTSIDNAIMMSSNKNLDINKVCKIKTYIPTEEKFKILKDFFILFDEHVCDYPEFESFVAYVFFNLKMIQCYTDLDIDLTYSCFDKLQTNNLMTRVLNEVGQDYKLFLNLIKMTDKFE